jgi:hypothetical protein
MNALQPTSELPAFDRQFFVRERPLTRIGRAEIGGKAEGLTRASRLLSERRAELTLPGIEVGIPSLAVISTDFFEVFLERNKLGEWVSEEWSDERIAHQLQRAELPVELVGDLRALAEQVRSPLAVRSSSQLEDALGRPFAGVYGTKMVPNNQTDADSRFRSLMEAVKFVYATTFFAGARSYLEATGPAGQEEKMAVIIQEVVGRRHGGRFYPDLSGVARSWNFYPAGAAKPEEGVVSLALGLGKTIVDGGRCWSFSPAHPRASPPFRSTADLLKATQVEFWAVNMGPPPAYDPIAETEYLLRAGLEAAEADGTLRYVASTYDPASDRITPGTGRPGPRVANFAPLLTLSDTPLVEEIRRILRVCEEALGGPVEIEFAVSIDPEQTPAAQFGFLQLRPLVVPDDVVELSAAELEGPEVLVASHSALGNGRLESIVDVVFVDPKTFEVAHTGEIARELERFNRALLAERRPYLLIGFGRWGSSDPWLGIPVTWQQIAGARVVVEAMLPQMNVEPSQGSHFFHNISSRGVCYFTVPVQARGIDWDWLERQPVISRSPHLQHVRCKEPLRVEVDGRRRRGVIRYQRGE